MLTITPNAAEAIRAIVEATDVPDAGGIRISMASQDGPEQALELSISPAPMEGDKVLDEEGAHVFLDEAASTALGEMSLDAEIEGDAISFGFVEREEESGPEPPL